MTARPSILVALLLAAAGCASGSSGSSAASDSLWPDAQTAVRLEQVVVPEHSCSADTPALTLDSIGPVRVGMRVPEVDSACGGAARRWMLRGTARVPVVVLRLGAVVLFAQMEDTTAGARVLRIATSSGAARTVDNVGPGMRVQELGALWPDITVVAQRGGLFLSSPSRPQIVMEIRLPTNLSAAELDRAMEMRDWRRLPGDSYIASIELLGIT